MRSELPVARPAAGAAAGAAVGAAAARVHATLDAVFATVAEVRDASSRRLAEVAAAGRAPVRADLAPLRPLLLPRLGPLVCGLGFIAAPGLLADAAWYLEWWQTGPAGVPSQLLPDLDPESSALYDYTAWDWFTGPRGGAERTVCGPYVDYLCSDEYVLTLSAPVHVGGVFAGVAAADVFARTFENEIVPALREIPAPAFVVNAPGRVMASNTAAWPPGAVYRGGRGFDARPCGSTVSLLVGAR
ncbi:cache domain-containing protein [Actinomadura litoris]|uniref:cache domain-containing protein n=1 Tax=Actinomadura litoris TaxID=2678616 RepID=UPI001FA7FA4B|nr:cache domain-containing protein [Actinomadura litoris]